MFSFWNEKNERSEKRYQRPRRPPARKHSDEMPRSKRANLELVEKDRQIGKVKVEKKPHTKSGFWTETPEGNKSNMRFKKNIDTISSDSDSESQNLCELASEVVKLRSDVDLLLDNNEESKINQLTVRINQLEDAFMQQREYVHQVLSLVTSALKENISEEPASDKDKQEDKISEEEIKDTSEVTKDIILNSPDEILNFDKRLEKDSEVTFSFKDGYVYALITEESTVHIEEITTTEGDAIPVESLEFPITLTYLSDHTRSETETTDVDSTVESIVKVSEPPSIEVTLETEITETVQTESNLAEPQTEVIEEDKTEVEVIEEENEAVKTEMEIVEEKTEVVKTEMEVIEEEIIITKAEMETIEENISIDEPEISSTDIPTPPPNPVEVKLPPLPKLEPEPEEENNSDDEVLELPSIRGYVMPHNGPGVRIQPTQLPPFMQGL